MSDQAVPQPSFQEAAARLSCAAERLHTGARIDPCDADCALRMALNAERKVQAFMRDEATADDVRRALAEGEAYISAAKERARSGRYMPNPYAGPV